MRPCECGSFSSPRGSDKLRQTLRGQGQKHQAEKRREAQVETMLIILDWFCPEVRALVHTRVPHLQPEGSDYRGPWPGITREARRVALQLGALEQ